jgi:hypothetical protein
MQLATVTLLVLVRRDIVSRFLGTQLFLFLLLGSLWTRDNSVGCGLSQSYRQGTFAAYARAPFLRQMRLDHVGCGVRPTKCLGAKGGCCASFREFEDEPSV